jgi:methyltransferase (TIGR00027 family)
VPAEDRLIRNVSDTALWVAAYRAQETERPDALFSDPFARRLAGERGQQIAVATPFQGKNSWPFVARTLSFDEIVTTQVQKGVDMVVNLAAGLDARPYRMSLPASLKWVEVDLPDILTYKEEILANDKPVCSLERIRLDLSNVSARRAIFTDLSRRARKVLVLSEGLLAYFTAEEVSALASDLAAPHSFQLWANDIGSPGLMRMLQKRLQSQLDPANAPLKFAPPEGPEYFSKFGWKPVEIRNVLKTAARVKRLPFFLRIMALFPESNGAQGNRPWSAILLCEKQAAAK